MATDDPLRLTMWGPTSAGKTMLLAQLYLNQSREDYRGWQVRPATDSTKKFITRLRDRVRTNNRFADPTEIGSKEDVEYLLHHPESGRSAVISMEDRAGQDWQDLPDEALARMREADGLVLVLDPLLDRAQMAAALSKLLETLDIPRMRERQTIDDRPVAVCLSKADTLVQTSADLEWVERNPSGFVRVWLKKERRERELIEAIERSFSRYQLFPVSAAGVIGRYGAVRPVVFHDEDFEVRLRSDGRPLNLFAPFQWLLDRLAPRASEGQ